MNNMFDLNINQTANLIAAVGATNTVLVLGHMGSGKTSLLKILKDERRFPQFKNHVPVYFDCTTKDLGDMALPRVARHEETGNEYATFVPNEELGLHLGKPILLLIDEFGKAFPGVKLAALRLMLEREFGGHKLHPDSRIIATSNLAAEGVNDLLPPHALNRLLVVRMRKASATEWVEDYAISAGAHPAICAWVQETPACFQSFEEVANPDAPEEEGGNHLIYHPKVKRPAFVTHRSMAAASNILYKRDVLGEAVTQAALVGTIGQAAAGKLMAYLHAYEDIPSLESIKTAPLNAKIPSTAMGTLMTVYRTLVLLDKGWINAWMDYLGRLDTKAQAVFVNQVRAERYKLRDDVMKNMKFTQWCHTNGYMFAADKK